MCVQTSAADSAAGRKMVGGSYVERKVIGWKPVAVACASHDPSRSALIECDDGRDRWVSYDQVEKLPEEMKAAAFKFS